MKGAEPRASRMLSERTTIWATSPIGFCSYDILPYCVGSVPSQLEPGNMLGQVGFGFGFVSNINTLKFPQLEANLFIKRVEKT